MDLGIPKGTISPLFSVNLFGTLSCTALLCFARKELLLKLGSTRQKLDEQLLRTWGNAESESGYSDLGRVRNGFPSGAFQRCPAYAWLGRLRLHCCGSQSWCQAQLWQLGFTVGGKGWAAKKHASKIQSWRKAMQEVSSALCFVSFAFSSLFLLSSLFAWPAEPTFMGGACLYMSSLCRMVVTEVLVACGKSVRRSMSIK